MTTDIGSSFDLSPANPIFAELTKAWVDHPDGLRAVADRMTANRPETRAEVEFIVRCLEKEAEIMDRAAEEAFGDMSTIPGVPVQAEPSAEAEPLWHSRTEGPLTVPDDDLPYEDRVLYDANDRTVCKIFSAAAMTLAPMLGPVTDTTTAEEYIGRADRWQLLFIATADPATGLKASHAAIARLGAERDRDRATIRRLERAVKIYREGIDAFRKTSPYVTGLVDRLVAEIEEREYLAIDGDALQSTGCADRGD